MDKFYQLTHPSTEKFANNIVADINKDYPNSAFVKNQANGFVVLIKMEYYNYCKDYVKAQCRMNSEEIRKSA